MKLISIDPQTDPIWQQLIRQYRSDVFHSPEWLGVLARTYCFEPRALVVLDEAGQPRSGMAYCQIEDINAPRIVSLPFSDFCDPLVANGEDWLSLTNQLRAEQCSITVRCLHNDIPLQHEAQVRPLAGFALIKRAKWHSLDLQADLETLWQGLHGSARRAINKAQRDGVVVHLAQQKEVLRAFFELHLGVRKYKYHLLAQPYSFFEHIWDYFMTRQKGALMVAIHQDKIIGGVIFLEWQHKLYYKFNASDPAYISLRPNDLIVWEGIKYGLAKGYTYLDFGLSDWDQEGLLQYKRKFASEEKTISFLRYTPNGAQTSQVHPLRNVLSELTALLTDASVPDQVTEKAGEVLYQFFA